MGGQVGESPGLADLERLFQLIQPLNALEGAQTTTAGVSLAMPEVPDETTSVEG